MILLLAILFLDHSWVRVDYQRGLNNFTVMHAALRVVMYELLNYAIVISSCVWTKLRPSVMQDISCGLCSSYL